MRVTQTSPTTPRSSCPVTRMGIKRSESSRHSTLTFPSYRLPSLHSQNHKSLLLKNTNNSNKRRPYGRAKTAQQKIIKCPIHKIGLKANQKLLLTDTLLFIVLLRKEQVNFLDADGYLLPNQMVLQIRITNSQDT